MPTPLAIGLASADFSIVLSVTRACVGARCNATGQRPHPLFRLVAISSLSQGNACPHLRFPIPLAVCLVGSPRKARSLVWAPCQAPRSATADVTALDRVHRAGVTGDSGAWVAQAR
jgi:hypothetical protein